jgi:hypothetical protein
MKRIDRSVKTARLTLFLAAIITVVVACEGSSMEPSMSLTEAQASLHKEIKDAATASFPSGFTLEDRGPQPQKCTDSVGKPDGRENMGMLFWVNGADRANNNAYFDALKNWWTTHGWSPDTDSRPGDMFMNATRDGYLMGLESTPDGRLTIEGTTPCVWPNGTPQPRNS